MRRLNTVFVALLLTLLIVQPVLACTGLYSWFDRVFGPDHLFALRPFELTLPATLEELPGHVTLGTEKVDDFRGCQHGRIVKFRSGMHVTCDDYGYDFAGYGTEVVIVARPHASGTSNYVCRFDCKMIVTEYLDHDVYDVLCNDYMEDLYGPAPASGGIPEVHTRPPKPVIRDVSVMPGYPDHVSIDFDVRVAEGNSHIQCLQLWRRQLDVGVTQPTLVRKQCYAEPVESVQGVMHGYPPGEPDFIRGARYQFELWAADGQGRTTPSDPFIFTIPSQTEQTTSSRPTQTVSTGPPKPVITGTYPLAYPHHVGVQFNVRVGAGESSISCLELWRRRIDSGQARATLVTQMCLDEPTSTGWSGGISGYPSGNPDFVLGGIYEFVLRMVDEQGRSTASDPFIFTVVAF